MVGLLVVSPIKILLVELQGLAELALGYMYTSCVPLFQTNIKESWTLIVMGRKGFSFASGTTQLGTRNVLGRVATGFCCDGASLDF